MTRRHTHVYSHPQLSIHKTENGSGNTSWYFFVFFFFYWGCFSCTSQAGERGRCWQMTHFVTKTHKQTTTKNKLIPEFSVFDEHKVTFGYLFPLFVTWHPGVQVLFIHKKAPRKWTFWLFFFFDTWLYTHTLKKLITECQTGFLAFFMLLHHISI